MPYKMRKIRGKDLYKVWNSETGDVKSAGSTKKDAKAQMRLLRDLEGGALPADKVKKLIDNSYTNEMIDNIDGYEIDRELSDGRVKVYKDQNSDQAIVTHRGSSGWRDWTDNVRYILKDEFEDTATYKKHEKKQKKAIDKYGANNIINVGHSRGALYAEQMNKNQPVKEVITYNKLVVPKEVLSTTPANQTDIRSSKDVVSLLLPLQMKKNDYINIKSNTLNPLKAHGTSALETIGTTLVGKGFSVRGKFLETKLRVPEMKRFIKMFKKKKGEKWSGAKVSKKQLIAMIEPMLKEFKEQSSLSGDGVFSSVVKGLNKINPVAVALNNKKASKLMNKSGQVTNDNILPAVVEVGVPVMNATANAVLPGLGGEISKKAYDKMVVSKGYDPRERQKNEKLKIVSKEVGKVAEQKVKKTKV